MLIPQRRVLIHKLLSERYKQVNILLPETTETSMTTRTEALLPFLTLLIFSLSLPLPIHAQIVNRPPTPSWLKAASAGDAVEKRFDYSGKLLKGILFLAVEENTSVFVNGKPVGSFEHKDHAVSIDLTSSLREGSNVLMLRSRGAVAVLLELNGDLARRQWVVSDDSWKATQGKLEVRGPVDADAKTNPFDLRKTFDAYNSWQLAKSDNQNQATDASTLTLPDAFHAELIRSSSGNEGSWIAMAFDPQGRITLAREKKGLLRLTMKESRVENVEVINDTLLEVRGLLYAHGALYADANNTKALFRLRDTKGDGRFDEVTELLRNEGGVGHGRNHVKLGPDGKIYIAHGNNVLLSSPLSLNSPVKSFASDQLILNPWDGKMFDGDVQLPAGHVLRMNPDGTDVELLAVGLRNPMDIAFNRNGELFTFDADMERDVGALWYMPTRVLHVVPGADFGWRRGTGRFPAWYVDTLPSVLDVGLSSPTGIFFGYGAKFPARYQEALFCFDWAYGRILLVHLAPKGASFTGTQETFVSGRPLNVTDGCIGPDGALWFVTGGRGTQSGLYRVTYAGPVESVAAAEHLKQENAITPMQAQRRTIEDLRYKQSISDAELGEILKALGSEDRSLAHAARTALGTIPAERWKLISLSGRAWLQGALALVHEDRKASRDEILTGLLQRLSRDDRQNFPDDLRVLELVFIRLEPPSEAERKVWLNLLEPLYRGTPDDTANRELCKVLVYLGSPSVVEKTVKLLETAKESEDLVHYPLHLRYVKTGWTLERRRAVFEALNRAEKLNGASSYFKAIQDIRTEMAASLSPDESKELDALIHPKQPAQMVTAALAGPTVREWKLEDLTPFLEQAARGRSFVKARAALISTGCVACHRVSSDPAMPAGVVGPDLTQVSSRFNRRDLLDNIINPSKVIDDKYRNVIVTLTDGTRAAGSVESEDDLRLVLRPNPLAPERIEIPRNKIKSRKLSDVSPMPTGLLNTLTAEQIMDVLAWFEAGGDPKYKAFQP
jgi:hypothetical protein